MGLLVDGNWHTDWYDTKSSNGEFIRQDSQFRDWVGSEGLPVEAGRYHLFVSLACPWAHRALIFRKLMKLEDAIGVTVVKPEMLDNGWEIDDQVSQDAGYSPNPVEHVQYLYQLYTLAEPQYNSRVTVPVLWDKVANRIVNNIHPIINIVVHLFVDAINFGQQRFRAKIRFYHAQRPKNPIKQLTIK